MKASINIMKKRSFKKTFMGMARLLAVLFAQAVSGPALAQTFTPLVEDSIDFVITGTTPAKTDSVAWFLVAPYRQCLVPRVPVVDGRFRIAG